MLANAGDVLVPGGSLLFVSHDESSPRRGWSQGDRLTLTTPEQIVAELQGLRIAEAKALMGSTPAHVEGSEPKGLARGAHESGTTVVLATKPY